MLADNYDQNLALANAVYQSVSMAGVHEDWMERLESRVCSIGRSSSCRPPRPWRSGVTTTRA